MRLICTKKKRNRTEQNSSIQLDFLINRKRGAKRGRANSRSTKLGLTLLLAKRNMIQAKAATSCSGSFGKVARIHDSPKLEMGSRASEKSR